MPTKSLPQLAARKQRALGLLQRGQARQAGILYDKLCREFPNDAESHYMLGTTCGQLGRLKEAADSFRTCLRLQPNAFVAHCGLAAAYKGLGKYTEAEQSLRMALGLQPGHVDVLQELAGILLLQDRMEEAESLLQQILESGQPTADALHGLGEIKHASGRFREAIDLYQRALKSDPNRANTFNRTGHAQFMLGQYQEAIRNYRMAVRLKPDFAEAYKNLGTALMTAGQADAAREALLQALKVRPDYTDALICEIDLHEHEGDLPGAYERLARLIGQDIEHPGLATTFLNICSHVGRCDEAIAYAERVLENHRLPATTELMVDFALGKLHDRLRNYPRAFEYFQRGNELKPDSFNASEHIAIIDALITLYSWQFFTAAPRASVRSERPVFIVGMPRSGTSLTEQILASHPQVYGAGELPDVGSMVYSLPGIIGDKPPYPFNLAKVTPDTLDRFARDYLDHIGNLNDTAMRVTDKMPQNFLFLGLIAQVFPEARVIHCVRDPRDTCLSIYFQNFSEAHGYASRLGNIGLYYRKYEELMQHYKAVLDIPFLEVSYEDLVANQERVTRELVEFAGLEWDDRCLEFNRTKRFVATSSYDQVREGLYTKSAGRWKNYEQYLDPLLEALGLRRLPGSDKQ